MVYMAKDIKENGVVKNNKWSGIPSTPEELKRVNKTWKDIEDCFKIIDKIKK
jgi:hypothetical protein